MKPKTPQWRTALAEMLLKRDRYICSLCGEKLFNGEIYDIDHIVEKSEGGDESPDNLRVVHTICHKLRHAPNRKKIIGNEAPTGKFSSLQQCVECAEKNFIEQFLKSTNGNITKASRLLKISRPTLYEKMKKYKLI